MDESVLIVGVGSGLSASLARLCFSKGMKVVLAARNIENVKPIPANLINAKDVVNRSKVVITVDGVRKIEELWGGVRRMRRAQLVEKV